MQTVAYSGGFFHLTGKPSPDKAHRLMGEGGDAELIKTLQPLRFDSKRLREPNFGEKFFEIAHLFDKDFSPFIL